MSANTTSMAFKEIYDEILAYVPDLPMYDAMNLINSAISTLNSKNFVQEQLLTYTVEDTEDSFNIQKSTDQSSYLEVQVLKVLRVTNDDNVAMARRGIGQEYVDNYNNSDYLSYNQTGDMVYVEVNGTGVDQTYSVECYTTLPKYEWNSGSPQFADGDDSGDIKDSFRSAIRFLVLSYVYSIDKFGKLDLEKAVEYNNRAQKAISNLLENEIQYKEKI